MSGKKITIYIIASDVFKDQACHACDLFESWKVLMENPVPFVGTLKEGETLATVIPKMKAALEASGQYRVTAIFHPYMEEGAWCDQEILMFSDGRQFGKFADYLESLHYCGPMPRRYLESAHV